jgi:hypothetical protein
VSAPLAPGNTRRRDSAPTSGIIEGSIQSLKYAKNMEAERINALSALLNDLTSREAELRRYL